MVREMEAAEVEARKEARRCNPAVINNVLAKVEERKQCLAALEKKMSDAWAVVQSDLPGTTQDGVTMADVERFDKS